jgi:predicted MFS family arabinose efflux permease
MIAENSTPKTQARAFSIFAFFGNIGIFLGVLVGGLADPANQYPRLFGNINFFHSFPYAFPTLISGVLVLSALLVTIFFVEEVR